MVDQLVLLGSCNGCQTLCLLKRSGTIPATIARWRLYAIECCVTIWSLHSHMRVLQHRMLQGPVLPKHKLRVVVNQMQRLLLFRQLALLLLDHHVNDLFSVNVVRILRLSVVALSSRCGVLSLTVISVKLIIGSTVAHNLRRFFVDLVFNCELFREDWRDTVKHGLERVKDNWVSLLEVGHSFSSFLLIGSSSSLFHQSRRPVAHLPFQV